MNRLLLALALVSVAHPLCAQSARPTIDAQQIPPVARTVSLAGPRIGVTMLTDRMVAKIQDDANLSVRNGISQFGWQFERQFYAKGDGPTVLNEWVLLAGGLDQGVLLPSLSWMVGVRSHEGTEIGVGPNVSASGVGLVIAAGITMRAGVLNVPMNVAVVPSRLGPRVSVLTGFTLRK